MVTIAFFSATVFSFLFILSSCNDKKVETEEHTEEENKKVVESLEDKDKVYIKILTYEFEDEYVSFRIFSQGEWKVKLVTEWVEEDKVKLWSILHFAYSIRDTRMERLSVISTTKSLFVSSVAKREY